MADEQQRHGLADSALDALFFAPLGFLLEAHDLFPKLAARGRQQVDNARAVGRFAVPHLGRMIDRKVEQWRADLDSGRSTGAGAAAGASDEAVGIGPSEEEVEIPVRGVEAPPVESLPIPDYDSLAASQVLPRLVSLNADDLELVRRYESANRARRTILHGIAQLQAD